MTAFTHWLANLVQDNTKVILIAFSLYYMGILLGLIVLYGRGDFSTPGFIYQGF